MVSVRFSNDAVDTSILAEKITMPFSGLVAPNRFMKAPLSEAIATWDQHDISKRGVPTKELIALYERWGEGEIGIIITGNVMVDPEHLEGAGNSILSGNHDGRVEAFRELATASKKHGSLVVAQISHPGRQVRKIIQPNPVSASDIQLVKAVLPYAYAKPTPLTAQGIKEIVNKFARTSELLYEAGFDGVQIHGAHGYLLSQFLSPSTNKRTDNYGGSLENRSRIIFEIIAAVRRRVPDKFSISIKLNSVEFQDGAFDTEDCKELCKKLEQAEVDFVELSGGNYEVFAFEHKSEHTKQRESFFLDFSDSIRPSLTKTKVYVTGGFRTSSAMVSAIQGNSCDGIGLGRPLCDEPTLCAKLLAKGSNVHSARKPINLGGQAPEVWVASLQLVQVSQDLEPIDISDEKRRVDIIAAMTEGARVEAENEKSGRLAPRRPRVPGWNVPYSAPKGSSRAQVGA